MYTFTTIIATKTRMLFLSAYYLFAATLVLYYAHNICSFTQDWMNYNCLLTALYCLFIYSGFQSAERSHSRRFTISSHREFYYDSLCCAFSYLSVPFSLILVIVGFFWHVRCICLYVFVYCVHTNLCCDFSRYVCVSISFTLMIMVFVSFFFVVVWNEIRLLRFL